MTIYALVSELSSVRLWSLDAGQRLRLQLSEISKESTDDFSEICWLDDAGDVPLKEQVLLFNGHCLFESCFFNYWEAAVFLPGGHLMHGSG